MFAIKVPHIEKKFITCYSIATFIDPFKYIKDNVVNEIKLLLRKTHESRF